MIGRRIQAAILPLAVVLLTLMSCPSSINPEPSGNAVPDLPFSECPVAHAAIVGGLNLLEFDLCMSRIEADRTAYVPLVWATKAATGGDKRGLAGMLPAPGWLGVQGAGRVVVWAGHEGAWGPAADGRADNDAFRERILDWLLHGGGAVGFSTGHREWLQPDGFSPALTARLAGRGVAFLRIAGSIDAAALSRCSLLVIGNPWGDLGTAELDALETWVRGGGSLLVLGLGWSWTTYHDDPAGDGYPVNRLGGRLGFRVMDGWIRDPGAPNRAPEAPSFAVRPLSAYAPSALTVLRAAAMDVGAVKARAAAAPDALFVIEGAHMGLQLPTADWALLDDPAAALAGLDRLYAAELALAGGVNPPFHGDTVWILSADDPGAAWWMHSGNPIVYRADAARSELIPTFNRAGHPGWGIAHEQGHNMHIASCADLFVAEGTGEVWENIYGVWSYLQNGWDWTPQMGSGLFDKGHDYHAQANPDFSALAADPFVLLGCLELIWTRYGWEGMRRFMTRAAADAAAGMGAGNDAARTAYFVEGLSAAYGVDFAPLIAHWGFRVSDASSALTAVWEPCSIAW